MATTGQTLAQRGYTFAGPGAGPTTTSYGAVNFGNNLVLTGGTANNIATDELNHVMTLRNAITANGITPVAKPAINLDALASMGASLMNEQTVLVLARAFEDIGVSAYNGGSTYLSGSGYLMTAARILAVEGEHVGNIRLEVARLGIPIPPLDGADVVPPPSGSNLFSTNTANGLSAYRTPGQVLYLAYGFMGSVSAGWFFPNGVNGVLNTSTSAATSANLS